MTISLLDDGIFPRKFHFSFKEFDFSRKFHFRQNCFTLKCNYNIRVTAQVRKVRKSRIGQGKVMDFY